MTAEKLVFALRSIVLMIFVVLVVPFLPMIISGDWAWREAWVYGVIGVAGFVAGRALAAKRHPDILAERARSIQLTGAKPWDKILAPLLGLGSVLILAVAGLDARFDWSPAFSGIVHGAALALIIFGYVFGSWALVENRFFSGVVRIQTDRGHHVVTTGPYRFVRHPGYAAALWTYVALPFWLDSVWALIPALLLVGVVFVRTLLEDRTLQAELAGYKEFTTKTRYRLFPGVW